LVITVLTIVAPSSPFKLFSILDFMNNVAQFALFVILNVFCKGCDYPGAKIFDVSNVILIFLFIILFHVFLYFWSQMNSSHCL
jgi:hypothetical protein